MIVCDEPTPFKGDRIAINSFGFGGANAHSLFKRHMKQKINKGIPEDNLPRLVHWAGRTEEAVNYVLDALEQQSLDAEYIALLHSAQEDETPGYIHRGYTVLAKDMTSGTTSNAISLARATQHVDGGKPPVVWIFSGNFV